jgi:hypothetical protein
MTNITRVDSLTSHGWIVRIQRKPVRLAKFFSDYAYGGESASKKAAESYRDSKKKGLKPKMVVTLGLS